MAPRYFEFKDNKSSKFWSIDLSGSNVLIVYGKIGTDGQKLDKSFPSEKDAAKFYEKKINDKIREGYIEKNTKIKKSSTDNNKSVKSEKVDASWVAKNIDEILEKEIPGDTYGYNVDAFDIIGKISSNSGLKPEIINIVVDSVTRHDHWLCSHPNTPKVSLLKIFERNKKGPNKEDIRNYISSNLNCPEELFIELIKYKDCKNNVAENSSCPAEILEILSKDGDDSVRASVADNLSCPIEILQALAKDKKANVRASVAYSNRCNLDLLQLLSTDKDKSVLRCIAKNLNATEELLSKISSQVFESDIAANPNASQEFLNKCAKSKEVETREALAGNKNLPPNIFLTLAKDKKPDVYYKLSKNPSLTKEAADVFTDSQLYKIYEFWGNSISCEEEGSHNFHSLILHRMTQLDEVLDWIYEHPNLSGDDVMIAAKSKNAKIRSIVAKNPNIPEEILVKLSKDKDKEVRAGVAGNPRTPKDILIGFLSDSHKVMFHAMENPSIPETALADFIDNAPKDLSLRWVARKTPSKLIQDKLLRLGDRYVYEGLAHNRVINDILVDAMLVHYESPDE